MTQPDLFVVCKNCGSEVSPYVTECPYCGQRVRKRAPKLDKGSTTERRRPRRKVRMPRLRPEEIEGIAPETRPWGTLTVIVLSLVATLVFAADRALDMGQVIVPGLDDPWRWLTSIFLYELELGYAFVALMATAIFGTLLERRFGLVAAVLTFLLAGFAGNALAVLSEAPALFADEPYAVLGGNGASLGLLTAWLVDDRVAARRGQERGSDLLGVYVLAAVLVLLSLAVQQANIAAAAGGALTGALLGLLLPVFTRR